MILKKLNIIILALGLVFMVSCKDEEKQPKAATQPATEASTTTNDTAVTLNPAHGLPGHRCDLPVGAPLDGSNPGETANPTPTSQLPSTSVSPVRVNQTPTVNPPHGEPGHDCAVPVGAPLNK
ncbi:hypothetical protein [Salinimicrobium xinjiangense]|uniref:hypothetical protein n=1 Tax=Salinimicrobium xinjiangense TaxID=438596 RepID=UPI00041B67D3|nr:hypothetical protein [Salinimicrobium xinjiangense]